jgi:hypothetical protein
MRGRRHSIIVRVAFAVLVAAACGSTSTSIPSLADYAAGRWACVLTAKGGPVPAPPVKVGATVSAASATSGTVQISLPSIPISLPGSVSPRVLKGRWQLRSGTLLVTWDDPSMGTTTARPIALDTTRFNIKDEVPQQPGQWAEVKVNRQARSVTFAFPTGPAPGQLTCTKA